MERPERPSRPEKSMRSGSHPYRERHRIVSSDSESDMEIDLSCPPVRLRAMRLQRPSRPSVEAITNLTLPNTNAVGASSSTSSTDPYHMPSPVRLREMRDTENSDGQSLYPPFMLKDDSTHRSPGLNVTFYRKRPAQPHFVSPLSSGNAISDVLERRSGIRGCSRARFPSPHTNSPNWEAKRFCSGLSGDPLTAGPEQKMQHGHGRLISATVPSCLLDPHSSASNNDRPDREDLRVVRPHANNLSWQSGGGPNDAGVSNSLIQYFGQDENCNLRNIENQELAITNNVLTDSNGRNSHSGIGLRHSSNHLSGLQNDNTSDHPTRATSHFLRVLDELRYTPMRDPWLHVDHIEHPVDPGLELAPCRNNNSSPFNNNSAMEDFNVDGSDNERDEIENPPVAVEDVSTDLEDYNATSIVDPGNRLVSTISVSVALTHPTDSNNRVVAGNNCNNESTNNNDNSDINFIENDENNRPKTIQLSVNTVPFVRSARPTTSTAGQNRDANETVGDNDCTAGTSSSTGGAGDDVIILTMSPSPQRQQQQEVVVVSQPSDSQQNVTTQDATNETVATTANTAVSEIPQTQSNKTDTNNTNNTSGNCSLNETADSETPLDCEEFNSKLVSLLECPVCMDTIIPPIHQCRKGHPVCQVCRPKLTVCPTCRARFSENRNLLMEKVTEMMSFPCKNVHMGCPMKVQLKDKKMHEVSCGFRRYSCIIGACTWKGFKQELVVHVSMMHKHLVIVGNNQKIRVSLHPNVLQTTWVLSALDEVFLVTFINKDRFLSGCTIYLGNCESAKNYSFEFTLSNKEKGIHVRWRQQTFHDQGQIRSHHMPYELIMKKGFTLPVDRLVFDDHEYLPHANKKVDVTVNVFKNEPAVD